MIDALNMDFIGHLTPQSKHATSFGSNVGGAYHLMSELDDISAIYHKYHLQPAPYRMPGGTVAMAIWLVVNEVYFGPDLSTLPDPVKFLERRTYKIEGSEKEGFLMNKLLIPVGVTPGGHLQALDHAITIAAPWLNSHVKAQALNFGQKVYGDVTAMLAMMRDDADASSFLAPEAQVMDYHAFMTYVKGLEGPKKPKGDAA